MTIFKRGKVCWYHFWFNGEHVQKSTKQKNRNTARTIEAAYRTALAKGEVGITAPKPIPGFKSAMDEFLKWSENEHSGQRIGTFRRYRTSSVALRKYFKNKSLGKITPEEVERFKETRQSQFTTKRSGKDKEGVKHFV
jgi:hypothetical protein